MSLDHTLLHAVLRWLDFVGLTTLIGGLAFRSVIVRPPFLSRREFDSFERSCWRVVAGSIVLVALTSITDLILRTLMMSGVNLTGIGSALPVVLRQTHYGAVWLTRISLVGLIAVAWLLGRFSTSAVSCSTGASLLGAAAIALTTSLSGHSADWGDATLPVLMNWLHVLSISIWTGGLFTLGFVLPASLLPIDEKRTGQGFASIARRFSRMAACCAAGFLVTGFYNAWMQVASPGPLVTTSYGRTLLAKLSLVLVVLACAVLNRYYFLSLLGNRPGAHEQRIGRTVARFARVLLRGKEHGDVKGIRGQFLRSVRLEWVVVVAALGCTALLTQLPPARHIRSHQHREDHAVHQPQRGAAEATSPTVGGGKFVLDRGHRSW